MVGARQASIPYCLSLCCHSQFEDIPESKSALLELFKGLRLVVPAEIVKVGQGLVPFVLFSATSEVLENNEHSAGMIRAEDATLMVGRERNRWDQAIAVSRKAKMRS